MNTAELLVQCLQAEGVECIFGIPGEENASISSRVHAIYAIDDLDGQEKGRMV